MRPTGRSSFISVGYHFRSSSGSLCERPRGYPPAGIKTMPGSAAWATTHRKRLAVNGRNLIRRYEAIRAQRIDWSKEIRNTPSGRTYTYVDPLGPNGFIPTDEITTIYG